MPFIIEQHQIFANINYMIDAVKQFVHSETIYLMKSKSNSLAFTGHKF
jgi:hypothetical protein